MAFQGSMKLVAYRSALPSSSQIHDVFYVSLLRKHEETITPTSTQLLPITNDSNILPQPKVVLDRCVVRKDKYRPKSEILIKWKGHP